MASSLRVGLCDRALPRTGYTVVSSVLRRVCNVRSRDSFGNFRFFFLEGRSNDSRKEAPRTRLSVLFCFLVRSRYFVAPSSARFVPSSVWGRRCCSWQKTNLRARGAPYKDYVLSKENNGRVFSFRVFFSFSPVIVWSDLDALLPQVLRALRRTNDYDVSFRKVAHVLTPRPMTWLRAVSASASFTMSQFFLFVFFLGTVAKCGGDASETLDHHSDYSGNLTQAS